MLDRDHINSVHGRADMETTIDDKIREGVVLKYLSMVAERAAQTGRSPLEVIAADATAAIRTAGGAIGGMTPSHLSLLDAITVSNAPALEVRTHTTTSVALPPKTEFHLPHPFERVVYDDTNREITSPQLNMPIDVTAVESGILALTLSQPGRLFSYRAIAEECTRRYGSRERKRGGQLEPYETDPSNLKAHVNHVGNKLRTALRLEKGYDEGLKIFAAKPRTGYIAFPTLTRQTPSPS